MDEIADQPDNPREAAVTDSGFRCPQCDYNLTGLISERCPECGIAIDWPTLRREREREAARPGTCWERWPRRFKPVAFVATAVQAAFAPWILAEQLPARPPAIPAGLFLLGCFLIGVGSSRAIGNPDANSLTMWAVGVAAHVMLQTIVFGATLPLPRVRRPYRFWFAVTCYTSYPLLLEGLWAPPYLLPFHEMTNLWPFCLCWRSAGRSDCVASTSFLYYLWWLGLAIIAHARLSRLQRCRVAWMILAVLAMTIGSSYAGCTLGGMLTSFG
mgnify:CR=1 FL=1